MTNTKTRLVTWITANPGSYYHDACMSKGYCTSTQYLVTDFDKWLQWYDYECADKNTELPLPAFVGDTYAIALSVANELNKPTTTEGINA